MLTLWDIVRPASRARRKGRPKPAPRQRIAPAGARAARPPMQERYDAMVRDQLARHAVRVRKWRSSMSGVAWQLEYRDGTIARLIEAPRPRGPMSAAIFLHEIGHHAIGFHVYSPRCLEEYHAWVWALAEMERCGLNVTDAVRRRMHESLAYAVEKANRRGLKSLPTELVAYATYPEPRRRRRAR